MNTLEFGEMESGGEKLEGGNKKTKKKEKKCIQFK